MTSLYTKRICIECVVDPSLRSMMMSHLQFTDCSYCQSVSQDGNPIAMDFNPLAEYIEDSLRTEWDDAYDEAPYDKEDESEGGTGFPSIDTLDTTDILQNIQSETPLVTDDVSGDFISDLVGAIQMNHWCRIDPFGPKQSDVYLLGWNKFKLWCYDNANEDAPATEDWPEEWDDHEGYPLTHWKPIFMKTLEHVHSTQQEANKDEFKKEGQENLFPNLTLSESVGYADNVIRNFGVNTRYFRVRPVRPSVPDSEQQPLKAKEIGSHPHSPSPNRWSKIGDSVFYASGDVNTAIAEVKGHTGSATQVFTAEFRSTQPLLILDLSNLPNVSIFDERRRAIRPVLEFLAAFAKDVSRPYRDDTKEREYLPTQAVAKMIRELHIAGGRKLDGIAYRSAQGNGICYVLHFNNAQCYDYEKSPQGEIALELSADGVQKRPL